MKTNPSILEYVLPEDVPKADADFLEFYSQFNLLLTPVAFGMSYYRNRSLKWAAIHTLLAAPYVAYVLVDTFAHRETQEVIRVARDVERRLTT